jgi:hypothetical protein
VVGPAQGWDRGHGVAPATPPPRLRPPGVPGAPPRGDPYPCFLAAARRLACAYDSSPDRSFREPAPPTGDLRTHPCPRATRSRRGSGCAWPAVRPLARGSRAAGAVVASRESRDPRKSPGRWRLRER